MTFVAMAQSNYTTEGRRMTTMTTSEATATTTNTNTNNNNAGGISPSESTMTTSAYMVRVMAMNSSYDIPVTPHTRVSSVLREVAELAISFEQSIALGDVHAALCHGDIVLPVDGPIGLLPQNAVLRLLTNFDAGFDAIDEHLTVTLMSYHTIQQQQQIQMQQQRLQRQASMRTTAASLHGMRRVGSRSGLVTVPETSLILSPYDASLTPNSMFYPHAVVLAPHGKAQPYVIGQPATHYAGRSLVMSPPPPVGAAQYVAATPMPIVNGILATGTNTAVPHVAGTPWAMTEGSGAGVGGAVYRVPIRSADELLLPADLAERQRRATTTTTLTAYQSAPRSKSAQQDRFGTTTPTKSSPFVPLDPNGIKPKNRASGTSFRSIISLVSRPFSLGRRSSSSPQTGSVHTNLTEEERRENSSPQSVHAEQTPLPLKKESNGQPQTNYPIESNNNHNQQQQQRLSSQEEVEVEDREGSFEHEPRSFTRPPVDRRATLDEMHDAGSGPADGTLLSPHSAPAVDTTNTKVEDYSSLHEDNIHNKEGEEVQEAPMPVRRVSKSMTDTSQSHTLPSDHVISFNTTTLPSLPKTGITEEEEEENMGELNEKEQQQALVKKEKRKASTTVNSAPTSPEEGAAVVKAAVRRRRSSPNAAPGTTTAAASSSSHTSTASRTRITSVTRRMSEGGDPNNLAAVGSAMAAVANKRQQHHEEEHHHTPHTPTHLPILHSIEISHPRKRGHISTTTTTTTTTTKAAEAATKASAMRESIRGAAYMTVRDNSQTPTEKALAHDDKAKKTEEDELEEEERVRTPKPAHRKNSSATRLRHSKDVSPTLEEQNINKEEKEKEGIKSEKRRASQERAGSKERSLLSGGAIRERSHPLPSLPQLSPKSLKEVHGSIKESETRRISITGTAPHSSSRSTPSLKALPSPTAAADTKKKAANKKASPNAAATNDAAAEEQVMSSTGRRPRRTPRSPQATTITAVGGDAGTTANYTGTSPADDYALPFTPSPTPHTLVNPNADTVTPAPVTANIAHTALPNKATVKKRKASGAMKESSEEKAAAAEKESLSPNKQSAEETENNNETPAAPPQPKSILMISSLPRYTHQITFNTRGGRRKSSQLSSPSSALHTPNSANGHARGSTTSAKHASSSSSVERDSAHYTVESFDTEGKDFIRITLRDPIDPTIFHFSVPVDRHCPVGALRSWLTDEITARAREDGRPVPAFMDVKRYALYCGDTRLVDDSRLSFEDATRGKHDCIFSIRLLH